MARYLRIIEKLQEVKNEGVEEIVLFPSDNEKSNNVRRMLGIIRKYLGGLHTVKVINGRWFLQKEYWNMTESLYSRLVMFDELDTIRRGVKRNWITTLILIGSIVIGIVIFYWIYGPYIV